MKCKECEKEIYYLRNYVSGENRYRAYLAGNIEYDLIDFIGDEKINHYECPECSAVLATNEVDAIKLMESE